MSLKLLLLYIFCQVGHSYSLTEFQLQTTEMPDAGSDFATYCNFTNNEIYLITSKILGGSYTHHVVSYNIYNNNWARHAYTYALFIDGSSWTTIDDKIYIVDKFETFNLYDVTTKILNTVQFNVRYSCMVNDGRFVYIIGGENSNVFQILDSQSGQWVNNTNTLKINRRLAACEIQNGTIYVFGGYTGTSYTDSIETISVGSSDNVLTNTQSNSWILSDVTLTIARCRIASVICSTIDTDLIYLIGGGFNWNGIAHTAYNIIEIFNMENNSLIALPFGLKSARASPSVTCVNEYIYVMGGFDGDYDYVFNTWEKSNTLYTLEPTNNPSSTPTDIPSNIPSENPSSMPTDNQSELLTFKPSNNPTYISTTSGSIPTTTMIPYEVVIIISFTYNISNITKDINMYQILNNTITTLINNGINNNSIDCFEHTVDINVTEEANSTVLLTATILICYKKDANTLVSYFNSTLQNDFIHNINSDNEIIATNVNTDITGVQIRFDNDISSTIVMTGIVSTNDDETNNEDNEDIDSLLLIAIIAGATSILCLIGFILCYIVKTKRKQFHFVEVEMQGNDLNMVPVMPIRKERGSTILFYEQDDKNDQMNITAGGENVLPDQITGGEPMDKDLDAVNKATDAGNNKSKNIDKIPQNATPGHIKVKDSDSDIYESDD